MIIHTAEMASPVGRLKIYVAGEKLCALGFGHRDFKTQRWLESRFGDVEFKRAKDTAGTLSALRAYFKGDLGALDGIPVDTGGTQFQRAVWRALRRIPLGRTASYGEIARKIGRPKAVRAVGMANGANPVAIVIPCHRVIGGDGTLTGYGGGLDRKRWLLRHEGAVVTEAGRSLRRARVATGQLPLTLEKPVRAPSRRRPRG